jgi:hypothetical protein
MYPLTYLGGVGLVLLVSGILLYPGTQALLFAWLWFNLFIAIYEVYIVAQKDKFNPKQCPKDFWKEHVQDGFWLKAWHEYSCFSDRRYLSPMDFVFWIEFGNAILVILLWLAYLFHQPTLLMILLIIQAYHCSIYFLSLVQSKKYDQKVPWKRNLYLGISSLWIIIPLLCLIVS